MKYNISIILIGVFILTSLSNCLDEIDLDTPSVSDEKIVIQGKLIRGAPSTIEVSVTELFDFTGFNQPHTINSAIVELIDENGNRLLIPSILGGNYELDIPENSPDFSVEVGKSYQLSVGLDDTRKYESTLEPLLDVPEMMNLEFRLVSKFVEDFEGNFRERPFVQYRVTTPLLLAGNTEKVRLKWEYEGVFKLSDTPKDTTAPKTCFVYADINFDDVVIFDANEASVSMLDTFPIYEIPPIFPYAEGHYLTVFQEPLSAGAYEYFSMVRDAIERTGSIFEEPAGKIKSNFTNINNEREEVLGYFYAVSQDTMRILIEPDEVGNPTTYCPQLPVPGPPNECDDCLLLNSASLFPPDYWEM